jgi:hypothetical protein
VDCVSLFDEIDWSLKVSSSVPQPAIATINASSVALDARTM